MKITRDQAKLLADLQARIFLQLKIVLGYSHPNMLVVPDNVDYVVCETEDQDDENIQLLHREDLQVHIVDPQHIRIAAGSDPRNDHLVKKFMDDVSEALMEGKLWFDPGVTRTIDGITVHVDRKEMPNRAILFETNIEDHEGNLYGYPQICTFAKWDRRFKTAKLIIDQVWPQKAVIKKKDQPFVGADDDDSPESNEPDDNPPGPPRISLKERAVSYLINFLQNRFL